MAIFEDKTMLPNEYIDYNGNQWTHAMIEIFNSLMCKLGYAIISDSNEEIEFWRDLLKQQVKINILLSSKV
jgi:hypothetical protein